MNYNLEKIYRLYLMGAWISSDYDEQFFNHLIKTGQDSYKEFEEYKNENDNIKMKNYDYYFSKKRNTYISRSHYKNDFIDGYFYGRYPIINSLDILYETETERPETERGEEERAF